MRTIPIELIKVASNRQRREFDPGAINELAESIKNTGAGLLSPLVVRAEEDGFILVAGERRLRAITDIYALGGAFSHAGKPVPPGEVPVVEVGELSPLDAWEAELEENIRRVDLTWQERAQATASLMELRRAQAGEAEIASPTVSEVAKELQGKRGDIAALEATRRELIVSRFLGDAEVAAAPSLKEAFKILKKKDTARENAELAAVVGKSFSSASHRLLNENCLDWLATAPEASFEIVLTDPPYGMGADEFGDSGQGVGSAAHFYEDSYESWLSIMRVLPSALFRVAAVSAHAYLFCDFDRFPELRSRMSEAGWRVHRTPLIWHNPDGFRVPWPNAGPQRKYELILFAVKGERQANIIAPDVLTHRKDAALGHPAQKPVPLLLDLLRRSARPGDRVLDPFMGSGSTIEACHELKLAATGLELDPSAYGIAVKRLQNLGEMEKILL